MDFFQHQEVARRKTGLLIVYFVLAVLLIVLAVYAVVAGVLLTQVNDRRSEGRPFHLTDAWRPELFFPVAGGTLAVIGLGSLYRMASLRGGGEVVARQLGGRRLDPGTTDLGERKLLNVVEEMAIASGTPVPAVFLLDGEPGINAFAAGHQPGNAAIGVTRGSVETLSRDELQGVIAHEFSHILNGDMRLNLRLIGVLYGILLIALVGEGILRTIGRGSRRRSGKKGGGGLILIGLGLFVIGYVGLFFGKLIKSAVSRQREYLADAAAVQFTRNPPGLAGALKAIGGQPHGSLVAHAGAEEASHLFFGNALKHSFISLLATHPPLADRIRRLDPSFDGRFPPVAPQPRPSAAMPSSRQGAVELTIPLAGEPARGTSIPLDPAQFVSAVGAPEKRHLAYARELVAALPADLLDFAREPFSAVAVVYALLIDRDPVIRARQLEELGRSAGGPLADQTRKALPLVEPLQPQARLPLMEMLVATLQGLSVRQFRGLREGVHALIEADQKIDLFEYALQRLLIRQLGQRFEPKNAEAKRRSRGSLLPACGQLLSMLSHVGHGRDLQAARNAFDRGVAVLGAKAPLEFCPVEECSFKRLDQSLDQLAAASPRIKKRVLEACAACVVADGRVQPREAELLRIVGSSLDCPVPPLLA